MAVSCLKVTDLKRELEERDSEIAVNKSVLQLRLKQALIKTREESQNFLFEVPCGAQLISVRC